jgi:hypothetical protein
MFCSIGDTLAVIFDGKLALQVRAEELHEGGVAFEGDALFKDVEIIDLSPATGSGAASPVAERPKAPPPPEGRWISLSSPAETLKRALADRGQVVVENGLFDLVGAQFRYLCLGLRGGAIRARVKPLSGAVAMLYLRRSDSGYYFATIERGGKVQLGNQPGPVILAQVQTPLKSDDFREFTFSAVSDTLSVLLDGKQVLQARDAQRGEGWFGFSSIGGHTLLKDMEYKDLSAGIPEGLPTAAGAGPPGALLPGAQPGVPAPAVAPFDAAKAREHQKAWAEHLGVPVEFRNVRVRRLPASPSSATRAAPGRLWLGYDLGENPLKYIADVSEYTNIVLDDTWQKQGDACVNAARKHGLKVVMCVNGREEMGRFKSEGMAILDRNREIVPAVMLKFLTFFGLRPTKHR